MRFRYHNWHLRWRPTYEINVDFGFGFDQKVHIDKLDFINFFVLFRDFIWKIFGLQVFMFVSLILLLIHKLYFAFLLRFNFFLLWNLVPSLFPLLELKISENYSSMLWIVQFLFYFAFFFIVGFLTFICFTKLLFLLSILSLQ